MNVRVLRVVIVLAVSEVAEGRRRGGRVGGQDVWGAAIRKVAVVWLHWM